MHPHAATATHQIEAAALLFLIMVGVTAGYLLVCWLYPFRDCPRCRGTGKRRAPFGRTFALCSRCHGDRRQLRPGRHLLNYLRDIHTTGTDHNRRGTR